MTDDRIFKVPTEILPPFVDKFLEKLQFLQ